MSLVLSPTILLDLSRFKFQFVMLSCHIADVKVLVRVLVPATEKTSISIGSSLG